MANSFLGGTQADDGSGIKIDNSGNVFVSGSTSSTNFPTTTGAFQVIKAADTDVFVSKLSPTGTTLVYSTFLGGTQNDLIIKIALDSSSNIYVSGSTNSPNFPTDAGAFQKTPGGNYDIFVKKIPVKLS